MENNVIFNLKQAIWLWASSWFRVQVSPDYETWEIINTQWQSVSVVLKNSVQIERFEASFSDWYMTILRRWLSKNKSLEEKQEFKKQWNEWEMWYITLLAHNIFDANKSNTIKNWQKIYFWWTWAYITSDDNWRNLKFKDELNQEINLTQISEKTWQNNKVAISDSDSPWFLKDKLWKWFIFWSRVDVDFDKIDFSKYETSEIDNNFDLIIYDKRNNTKKRVSLLKILEKIDKNKDDLNLKMQKNLIKELSWQNTNWQIVSATLNHDLNIDLEDFLLWRYIVIFEDNLWKRQILSFEDNINYTSQFVTRNQIKVHINTYSYYKVRFYKFW